MTELRPILERIGLLQYLDCFVAEAFDTWEAVLEITESDLNSLNVKLGHRRKLQRAISDFKRQSGAQSPTLSRRKAPSVEDGYRSDVSTSENKTNKKSDPSSSGTGGSSTKRKYRRHSKPDEHAPERPASAYVIFSNQMRENLKGQDLSFTEIAKFVGERWQVLSQEQREPYDTQAASAKERYYSELTKYKKTPQWAQYQEYLVEFKQKHVTTHPDGKRSKLETETSASTRGTSQEQVDPGPVAPDPASPAIYSFSGVNSPSARSYSPMAVSPTMSTPHQSSTHPKLEGQERFSVHGPYGQSLANSIPPVLQPSIGSSRNQSFELNVRPRRSKHGSEPLPSLIHDDTSLSSESNGGYTNVPFQGALLALPDTPKAHSHRLLPVPVPTTVATPSPFDVRLPTLAPISGPPHDPRHGSSLEALLRAGDLARDAEHMNDRDRPP
ncbi:hypothetical protein B0A49_01823 [Cryomyces minteri]|uniref:HMG box domain-containing protein n=1 Tax=Cryomyces minteri TaxID=331657 RepID=A0A4U0XNZ7_9PEZI|nr:hypothetical protein B0A49_01823 [Cryomyces minteri]